MRNIRNIYFHDMKNVATNWVAAAVVLSLIVLPSLYAWFNIKASWDPYRNTSQIPVGVVNEDKGAIMLDKRIDVGKELFKTLQKNHSLDWHFVDREQAMDKLKYDDYYAVIVIPKDFSEKLSTVVSNHPTKATIEYYVNEKMNAITPKITEKGASTMTQQISSKFISTVDGAIFDLFNTIGIDLEKNLPDIELFQKYLFLLDDRLPDIKTALNSTSQDINNAENITSKIRGMIPEAKDAAGKGLTTIDSATALLTQAEERFYAISPTIKEDMEKVQQVTHQVDAFISNLQPLNFHSNQAEEIRSKTNDAINEMGNLQSLLIKMKDINTYIDHQQLQNKIKQIEGLVQNQFPAENGKLQQLNDQLKQLQELVQTQHQNRDERLGKAIDDLSTLQQRIKEVQTIADNIKDLTANMPTLEDVQNKTKAITQQVDAFINDYNQQIEPAIRTQFKNAMDTLQEARDVIVQVQAVIPQIETLLSHTDEKLAKGRDVLNIALGEYPFVKNKVDDLTNKIRDLNKKATIYDLIKLLRNDPNAKQGFFAEPVVLKENKIFPIANYGTGMTPFYTVLAIWVGGLLLISLLSTDVHHFEHYTRRQVYFGKAFTFLTFGLMQTLVVTTGDMWLLGVEIKEPLWFVLFGLFISFVFVLIVYSLVSVFNNVGKALAIVLLVLQISSSGGTFPVVLLPKFFQSINPYLPFTYAISLMREAVGGIFWKKVHTDLLFMILFGVLAIVLGAWLKEPINKYSSKLKEKSKKSGLFH
ncbi:YhgE/Pip domain-containing protein [Neobacillus fumarioli]|uniref:YhgE/Pip domain-containing protein n=1 Tax=Neobacillus fumarioli TaxID=105229 RepID=UPI000836CB0A|nr:YhgE/Pip domain-containing protein [Neobacillus fumarioli]